MKNKKNHIITYENFEDRCKTLAELIKSNKNIKNLYGIAKGGIIVATRISYLTGIPLTFIPNNNETCIIDDVTDSEASRHTFSNFKYFFPLIDVQFEEIKDHIKFWYEFKL